MFLHWLNDSTESVDSIITRVLGNSYALHKLFYVPVLKLFDTILSYY